jgi:hypothetical protein
MSFRDVVGDFPWPAALGLRYVRMTSCCVICPQFPSTACCVEGCLSYQARDIVAAHDVVLVDEVAMARYGEDAEVAGRCVSIAKVALHHDNIWWVISG